MSYVPATYKLAEVGSGSFAGLTGVAVAPRAWEYAGATFATSVRTTDLTGPLGAAPASGNVKGTAGPTFPGGFTIVITDGRNGKDGLANGQSPPAEPRCANGFCNFWSPDGSLNAQVSSEGRLPDAEMVKILKGFTFATPDRATWIDATKAFPIKP
jgi:hypothetical protein